MIFLDAPFTDGKLRKFEQGLMPKCREVEDLMQDPGVDSMAISRMKYRRISMFWLLVSNFNKRG